MEKLINCKSQFQSLKSKISFLEGKKQSLLSQLKEKEKEKKEIDIRLLLDNKAIEVFKALGESTQKKVISSIESFVTRIYQYIFQTNDRFKINYSIKRDVPNMSFVLVDNKGEEFDPITSMGGGVVDVLSFALRLIGLLLIRPRMRKFLILDEPFKHLSVQYRPRASELLKMLCKECEVQIIMTTHQPEFVGVGKIFKVDNREGKSMVEVGT